MLLQSKIQYKHYEPGEFTSIAERTLAEAEELINTYPWEAQRYHQPIGFTSPSISFRNMEGDHLKLALGYNQKFNLYLFPAQQKPRKKTVADLESAIKDVRDFYHGNELEGFKQERFVFNPKKHFETKSFEYQVTPKRAWAFSWFRLGFFTLLTLYFPIYEGTAFAFAAFFPFWFVFAGVNLIFLINYWWYERDTIIKITAGQDNFWISRNGNVLHYNKKDVKEIRYYKSPGNRNPWSDNIIIELILRDGQALKFTNLLIPFYTLLGKFQNTPSNCIDKAFPFAR
ncbi:hypothetical protein [Polluticoccus soli]|uniref:hypothetical protein n=1 Tax=Polluticoccus soli TaxID=3034150 RepID=UPI0023E29851|nr:hypothetical protein [Flavipsychrobacter sp. JY13-12]